MFDDKMLVKNTLLGDFDSFSFLIEKYKFKVSSFVYKIMPNRNSTETVTKEIFVKAFKNLGTYDFNVTFSKWLFSLAKYIIISHTQNSGMTMSLQQELSIDDFPETFDNNLLPEDFAKEIISIIRPSGPQVYNMTKKIPQSVPKAVHHVEPEHRHVEPERRKVNHYYEEPEEMPKRKAAAEPQRSVPKKRKKSHFVAYIILILFLLICLGIEIFVIRQLEKGIGASTKQSTTSNMTIDVHNV